MNVLFLTPDNKNAFRIREANVQINIGDLEMLLISVIRNYFGQASQQKSLIIDSQSQLFSKTKNIQFMNTYELSFTDFFLEFFRSGNGSLICTFSCFLRYFSDFFFFLLFYSYFRSFIFPKSVRFRTAFISPVWNRDLKKKKTPKCAENTQSQYRFV